MGGAGGLDGEGAGGVDMLFVALLAAQDQDVFIAQVAVFGHGCAGLVVQEGGHRSGGVGAVQH